MKPKNCVSYEIDVIFSDFSWLKVFLWILVLRQNIELRDENADLKAKLDEVTKDKNNAEERIHLLEAER